MVSDTSIRLIKKIVSNSASKEEIEQFNSWLEESEDNRKFYKQAKAIWEKLGSTSDSLEFDEAAAKKNIILKVQQNQTKARALKARFRISAAASILILFCIGYMFFVSGLLTNNSVVYSTRSKKVVDVVLLDNSRVWLNENSRLEVTRTFNNRQRKVLLEGEAYFEVARNEEKTFKVSTGRTTTKVLGTSFNLKHDEDKNVQLIVNSGNVEFYNKYSFKKRKIFSAGEKGDFNASGNQVSQLENTDLNYLSWKTGVLKFSDTPLDEVCKTLTNHFGVKVKSTVDDSDFSLTGTFRDEDLEAILSTIAITLDIEVISSDSNYSIISKTMQ